jgi:aspartate/methionine/tyrosine aminotransferase
VWNAFRRRYEEAEAGATSKPASYRPWEFMLDVDEVNYDPREMGAFLRRSGEQIINLSSGVNFLPPPERLLTRVGAALRDPSFFLDYDGPAGHALGRHAIAVSEKFRCERSVDLTDDHVLVTAGASAAFHLLAQVIAAERPRSLALVPIPTFPLAAASLSFVGLRVREIVHEGGDDRFIPTPAEFEREIDGPVGAIYVNLFNNPTGELFSADELRQLIALARDCRAFFVADVVSADLALEGAAPNVLDLAVEEDYVDRACLIGSLSKERSIPGFRIGWVVGSAPLVSDLARMNELIAPSSPAVSSAFLAIDMLCRAILAKDGEEDATASVCAAYAKAVTPTLEVHPEARPFVASVVDPEEIGALVGAYVSWQETLRAMLYRNWAVLRSDYGDVMRPRGVWKGDFNTFVNVDSTPADYLDVTHRLFRATGVQILPAPAFGLTPEEWAERGGLWTRLSFALEADVWEEGLARFVRFLGV